MNFIQIIIFFWRGLSNLFWRGAFKKYLGNRGLKKIERGGKFFFLERGLNFLVGWGVLKYIYIFLFLGEGVLVVKPFFCGPK